MRVRTGFLADIQSLRGIQGSDQRQFVQELLATVPDGRIKLYITMVGLHYRRAHASLFLSGEYVPLKVEGTKKRHVCAFARIYEDQAVVAIVPILVKGLCQETEMFPFGPSVWEDTWVIVPSWRPASCYQNLLNRGNPFLDRGRRQAEPPFGGGHGILPGCTAGAGDLSTG